MTVSSLDKVLAYVGSTGSTSISFILPGLFYYKISDPESLFQQRLAKGDDDESDEEDEDEEEAEGRVMGSWRGKGWRERILRKAALALAIYGVGVMVICLGVNLFFTGGAAH